MLQLPLEQAGAPLTVLQAPPQDPQFRVSVFLLISQPLAWLVSQSRKPAAQVYWHAPSAQPVAVMFGGALAAQSLPQVPQLAELVLRFASQPLPASPSQSSKSASQTWPQTPALQLGAALFQSSGQLVAQLPQRLGSTSVWDSQPSRVAFSSGEQSLQPAAQLFMLHAPRAHVGAPLAVLHAAAQPPQLASSVYTLVSQPSAEPPEQLPQPASQVVMLQVVPLQLPFAFVKALLQLTPQPPQFRSLLVMLVSQPLRLRFSSAEQSA